MTSNLIIFFSLTGNTRAIVELSNTSDYDVFDLSINDIKNIDFDKYETIFLGTSTYGQGVPHSYFKTIFKELNTINNKRIILFGSGNSIYPYFCGALDILEDLLSQKNEIICKFKFEAYPNRKALEDFQKLIDREVK